MKVSYRESEDLSAASLSASATSGELREDGDELREHRRERAIAALASVEGVEREYIRSLLREAL